MDVWNELLRLAGFAREVVREGVPGPLKPFVALIPDWGVLLIAGGLLVGVGYGAYKSARRFGMRLFDRKGFEANEPASRGDVDTLKRNVSDLTKVIAELQQQVRENNTVLAGVQVAVHRAPVAKEQTPEQKEQFRNALRKVDDLVGGQSPLIWRIGIYIRDLKGERDTRFQITKEDAWRSITASASEVAKLTHDISTLGNALSFASALTPEQIASLDDGLRQRQRLLAQLAGMPPPATADELRALDALHAEYENLHKILRALSEDLWRRADYR